MGPRLSDAGFFDVFDLSRMDMAKVKAAVEGRNWAGIRRAFAQHILTRIALFFFAVGPALGASPDLPLNHPAYPLLDRLDARGWIAISDTRPLTRMQVARLLAAVSHQPMSATERGLVERYIAELAGRAAFAREPRWAWRDSAASVILEPLMRQRVIARRGEAFSDETASQTYLGGSVRGQFHTLGFYARHYEAREWSDRARLTREDVLARPIEDAQLKGDKADFRESAFQLAWANAWIRLDAGKGSMDWGPGRTGNLSISNYAPSYGLFRLRASYRRLHYTHVAASLQARDGLIDTTRRWIDNGHVRIFSRQKRLAAHRLEIAFSKLCIGLHEAVVYGDRGFEPLYVLPVTVFAGAQNHLGNRDNLVIGADISLRPRTGLEVYAAWFLDDMVKFDPSAFANQFALQVGAFWVDPLGLRDTDIRAEYARVEPFVYAHNFDINTYEHRDAPLGYPTGPNADRWFGQVTHRFSPSLHASLAFERERQGENPVNEDGTVVNVGGDAQLGRRLEDAQTRAFMSGDVETRTKIAIRIEYAPVRNWVLQTRYTRQAGKNIVLPSGRGDAVGHEWAATVDVNFF